MLKNYFASSLVNTCCLPFPEWSPPPPSTTTPHPPPWALKAVKMFNLERGPPRVWGLTKRFIPSFFFVVFLGARLVTATIQTVRFFLFAQEKHNFKKNTCRLKYLLKAKILHKINKWFGNKKMCRLKQQRWLLEIQIDRYVQQQQIGSNLL